MGWEIFASKIENPEIKIELKSNSLVANFLRSSIFLGLLSLILDHDRRFHFVFHRRYRIFRHLGREWNASISVCSERKIDPNWCFENLKGSERGQEKKKHYVQDHPVPRQPYKVLRGERSLMNTH